MKEKWGELTDDELDKSKGRFDKLAGLLQERYGYAKDEAEQELEGFLEETRDSDFADENRPSTRRGATRAQDNQRPPTAVGGRMPSTVERARAPPCSILRPAARVAEGRKLHGN